MRPGSIQDAKRVLNEDLSEVELLEALKRDDWHWTFSKELIQESIIRRLVQRQQIKLLNSMLELGFEAAVLKMLQESSDIYFCKTWLEEMYLRQDNTAEQKLLILKALNK